MGAASGTPRKLNCQPGLLEAFVSREVFGDTEARTQ